MFGVSPAGQQAHSTAWEELILAVAGKCPWKGCWGKCSGSGCCWQTWFEVQPPIPVPAGLWRMEQRVSPHPPSVSGHCALPSQRFVRWKADGHAAPLDLLCGSSKWQKAEVPLENVPSAALSSSQKRPGETRAACQSQIARLGPKHSQSRVPEVRSSKSMEMCQQTGDREMSLATEGEEKMPGFLQKGKSIEMKWIKENLANLFFRFINSSDIPLKEPCSFIVWKGCTLSCAVNRSKVLLVHKFEVR